MTRTARMSTEHIYKFIVDYQKTHGGVPPTYKQIGEFAGISPKGPVAHHLAKLKDQGLVSSDESGRSYATGGIWISPKQIARLSYVLSQSGGGEYSLRLPKEFWDIMANITGKEDFSYTSIIRGKDLEPD